MPNPRGGAAATNVPENGLEAPVEADRAVFVVRAAPVLAGIEADQAGWKGLAAVADPVAILAAAADLHSEEIADQGAVRWGAADLPSVGVVAPADFADLAAQDLASAAPGVPVAGMKNAAPESKVCCEASTPTETA